MSTLSPRSSRPRLPSSPQANLPGTAAGATNLAGSPLPRPRLVAPAPRRPIVLHSTHHRHRRRRTDSGQTGSLGPVRDGSISTECAFHHGAASAWSPRHTRAQSQNELISNLDQEVGRLQIDEPSTTEPVVSLAGARRGMSGLTANSGPRTETSNLGHDEDPDLTPTKARMEGMKRAMSQSVSPQPRMPSVRSAGVPQWDLLESTGDSHLQSRQQDSSSWMSSRDCVFDVSPSPTTSPVKRVSYMRAPSPILRSFARNPLARDERRTAQAHFRQQSECSGPVADLGAMP